MESRIFNYNEDYKTISSWWHDWGWPLVPKEFLSTRGIIISGKGQDICAGWLYKTDSAAAWAEHYIVNKNIEKELRSQALDLLIDELAKLAKELGFKVVMSSVKNPSLIKRLTSKGFNQKIETNMSNLIRVL